MHSSEELKNETGKTGEGKPGEVRAFACPCTVNYYKNIGYLYVHTSGKPSTANRLMLA